jgi:flagellar hook-length control protein FliK
LQRGAGGHPHTSIAAETAAASSPAGSGQRVGGTSAGANVDAPPTTTHLTTPGTAVGAGSHAGDGPLAASPAAAVSAAPSAPGPSPLPAGPSVPASYGAGMQQAIETIHATVALASRQGAAQAQISLEPAELGAVRIHLTQTSDGLIARVSAQTAAAAQAIAGGRNELHGTLSSLGVSLLRLDIGSFSQQQAHGGGHTPADLRRQPRQRRSEAGEPEAAVGLSTGTVSLSAGAALIDVLA